MRNPSIVIIGGPNSGKTHYGGQLYGRLTRNPGAMRLRETPDDLTAFQEVMEALSNGRTAGRTSTQTWLELKLPLEDGEGRAIDLIWPDYGGEQIKDVFDHRSVNADWRKRLREAENWLMMIRLNSERVYPDVFRQVAKKPKKSEENMTSVRKEEKDRPKNWDANAYWVEKLQILLHAAGRGVVQPLTSPRIAILLSCYDEISEPQKTPIETLSKKLPLLSSFIRNNWQENQFSVWGLSALGQKLNNETNNDTFIDEGPEHQGWIIRPEGDKQDKDLTLPLQWLLDGYYS